MNQNILEIRHLSKDYGTFRLEDVSFSLPRGVIMGLIGENGAGKSTTINCILGEVQKSGGDITLFGQAQTASEKENKDRIGVVFDENHFPDLFTPKELGQVMAGVYSHWDWAAYRAFLARFSLREEQKIKDFSKGMKVKLAFAVALSHGAELLILDEATSGLDPIVRDEVLEIFNEFTREEDHSILISSHILSDLEKLCDYIAFLHQGRLLFCDEKDRLLEEYGIFVGTADQVNSLQDGAVVARENSSFGGVRCLVKRALVPAGWALERPTVEDIVLFLVKGAKEQ